MYNGCGEIVDKKCTSEATYPFLCRKRDEELSKGWGQM